MELSLLSCKGVFILVRSEQKQREDNLIQGGDSGGDGPSGCLVLSSLNFLS